MRFQVGMPQKLLLLRQLRAQTCVLFALNSSVADDSPTATNLRIENGPRFDQSRTAVVERRHGDRRHLRIPWGLTNDLGSWVAAVRRSGAVRSSARSVRSLLGENLLEGAPVNGNFFESYELAKQAMKDNLFTEVYLSTAVTTPIQLKGWVNQANPYQRHGQRWHLYLSRVEILRRLATRHRKSPSSAGEGGPA